MTTNKEVCILELCLSPNKPIYSPVTKKQLYFIKCECPFLSLYSSSRGAITAFLVGSSLNFCTPWPRTSSIVTSQITALLHRTDKPHFSKGVSARVFKRLEVLLDPWSKHVSFTTRLLIPCSEKQTFVSWRPPAHVYQSALLATPVSSFVHSFIYHFRIPVTIT